MENEMLDLRIDEKKMCATLTMYCPEGDNQALISMEEAERFLAEHGVVSGIKRDVLGVFLQYAKVGQEVVVAEGTQPGKGIDGHYEYKVEIEDDKKKPIVNPDGSVDYLNSLTLAMVEKGDLIAVYIPASEGEAGCNIFGEPIAPLKGREMPKLKGQGISPGEDGISYYADVSGHIHENDNGKLIIDPVYTVKGDLDTAQGNIKFNGDVEIKGDVRSGLTIETTGSIYIHGHVGGCTLCAGKDVTIRKGVQGREKCTISAGGNVVCSFVERCVIHAQGNIYADSIMTSEVTARKQVIVNSRKGQIVGGRILGSRGVIAKTVGNEAETDTILQSGFSEELIARVAELVAGKHKVNEQVSLIERNLTVYNSVGESKRTEETESVRKKLLNAKIQKVTEQKRIEEELERANEELRLIRDTGVVRVFGVSYAGLRVNIGKSWFELKEACRDVGFILRANGQLAMVPGEECKITVDNR
ncbi:MAG: FapA family protein [Eubacteriales bacterium]|nr:FapA family protein [Eubacteriales bacterium]